MRARPDASYVFRLVTDGETFVWRCKIVEGIPCKALTLLPVDASGDPDGWRLSFAPGDDGEPRIWVLGFRDRWMIGPESIELRVTVDGAALFERSWTPDYDGLDPSEPGCGGCEAWATSIALDAPARDA